MISATNRFGRVFLTLLLVSSSSWLTTAICSAALITVVNETFQGYNSFPQQKPPNDNVNLGVPLVSEGAGSALWLGARIQDGGNANGGNSVNTDVGVQETGSIIVTNPPQNMTHVGRVGDDAGLALRLDLTGVTNVTLDFDWRTYLHEADDRFVVAYYVGDGTEFQPEGLGTPNNTYDWGGDPQLGNGGNTWYNTNFTELLRAGPNQLFTHETFSLPGDDIVYLLFWSDDNNNIDFAKFDNVVITGVVVPEPSCLILLGLGMLATAFANSHRAR